MDYHSCVGYRLLNDRGVHDLTSSRDGKGKSSLSSFDNTEQVKWKRQEVIVFMLHFIILLTLFIQHFSTCHIIYCHHYL